MKFRHWVIVVLLVAGVAGFAFHFQQATGNTLTFNDAKLGFRLAYPETLLAEETNYGSIWIHSAQQSPPESAVTIEVGSFEKQYYHNSHAKTLDDYLQSYSNGDVRVIIESSRKLTINGFQALRQFYSVGVINHPSDELDFGSLGSVARGIRYIFWDGKSRFVVISSSVEGTSRAENVAALIDRIAMSFVWN